MVTTVKTVIIRLEIQGVVLLTNTNRMLMTWFGSIFIKNFVWFFLKYLKTLAYYWESKKT